MIGENAMGADNQQERLDSNVQNPQRLYAKRFARSEDIVRPTKRLVEVHRNVHPPFDNGQYLE